jgi:hypothetical protein
MQLMGGTSLTKQYASAVILTALYVVSSLIPISTFLGAAGPLAQLSLTICIAPLFGILLGPSKGFAFGLIAGILSAFVPGVSLIVPTVILGPAISGLLTGLCLQPFTRVGNLTIPGPVITAIYLAVIIVLYLITTYEAWWFMIYYVAALFVALVLQREPVAYDSNTEGISRYLQLIPLTLIGTITDFSMMTMGAVYILELPAVAFGFGIFPFMLAERAAATAIAAILIAVVLRAFPEIDWALRKR